MLNISDDGAEKGWFSKSVFDGLVGEHKSFDFAYQRRKDFYNFAKVKE